ncbi:MAG: ribonuclease III [Candidatus Muiribacteriota bacterium]
MQIENIIEAFENKINIKFNNKTILKRALTHSSCDETDIDNETLEFLGDSVLGLIISEYLILNFPKENEGFLAKVRAYLVRTEKLHEIALKMELGKYLLIGKGEEKSGGRKRSSILANALEAVIGAVYLDKRLDTTAKFVLNIYKEDLKKKNIDLNQFFDFKTKLQEFCQKKFHQIPVYKVISERGPDHNKIFEIEVNITNKVFGYGTGHSKKEAEQNAAKEAYFKISKG